MLARLLEHAPPAAVVLAGVGDPEPAPGPEPPGWSLPVAGPPALGFRGLASEARIPLVPLGGGWAQAAARVRRLAPRFLIAGCFPRILPPGWLRLAPGGALNLHPSMLPAYRGPDPLFWQLRHDERSGGVTLHRMTIRVDAGPILAQRRLPLAAEKAAEAIIETLAAAGAELIGALLAGRLGAERPQDETRASWFPWPDAAARELPRRWGRARAERFLRRAARWGPFPVRAGHETVLVERPLPAGPQGAPAGDWILFREPGRTWIRLRDGPLAVHEAVIRSAHSRER